MPSLLLQFKKRTDGTTSLTCVREDGSWTGSSLGASDGYGPLHDLAHYVVERHFGLTSGFLGLLARGWDITDFDVSARERIPDGEQAGLAEGVAGLLSGELVSDGLRLSAEEINWTLAESARSAGADVEFRPLPDEDLVQLRTRLAELQQQWSALPVGETLELKVNSV